MIDIHSQYGTFIIFCPVICDINCSQY